jgi:hypothetical protein
LRPAIFEHDEVAGGQTPNRPPVLVEDRGVHFHDLDADAQRRPL